MKRLFITALACIGAISIFAQQNQQYYEVATSPNHHEKAFRPNEVIVKFKTEGPVAMKAKANGAYSTSSVKTVDEVLSNYGIGVAEQLMPRTGFVPLPRRAKSYSGHEIEIADLSKLYCLKANADIDVNSLVEELSALPEVEFAEPNYLVYINSTPNDPLYSQQWGIPAVKVDALWEKSTITSKRPVIAILDTGVDITHPDLVDNIWTNQAEAEGSDGYDDDNNGFKDDIHGWDFVNQTSKIDDYNGHGTHCAGIAGAVGNNGIGICGANPDAYIMPITVMQSDGTGDVATIIKGIDYAAANGADVISMSFGGYSYSRAEEQALARAYMTAVLVAAAGNDNRCIYYGHHKIDDAPMFPAAFTFVLGVQAYNTLFSNYDCDGPIYSAYGEEELYNYELKAPGTNIMSTYPGGQYKSLNGTSMACPLVAGAVSRLLQSKQYPTKELLFGDLIHAANGDNVNFLAAYDIKDEDRKPNLALVTWRIEDETDGDGRFDAGEIINFYPTIRNEWGLANNIHVWMTKGELEGDVIEILQDEASFDKPLSSYAKAESANPFRFKMADDVVDGRHCRLIVYAQCDGMDEPMAQEIVITAENGVEIGGMIEQDMVLESGLNYIVTRMLVIPDNVSLTINPGTVIKFCDKSGISVSPNGKFLANGNKDNHILFTKRDNAEYAVVYIEVGSYDYPTYDSAIFNYCDFEQIHLFNFTHVIANNCSFTNQPTNSSYISNRTESFFRNCNFHDLPDYYFSLYDQVKICGLVNTNIIHALDYDYTGCARFSFNTDNSEGFAGNNILNMPFLVSSSKSGSIIKCNFPSYFGSSKESIVRNHIYDIDNPFKIDATWKFDLSNMLTQPSPSAHGIVWKVCVNGYDAQDEFEMLPPLGVGKHKFEVWYSKKIDETEAPLLAMGVRPPYTQTAIAEDGSWRTERMPYYLPENVKVLNGSCGDDYYSSKFWCKQMSGGLLSYTSLYGCEEFEGNCLYVFKKTGCNSMVGKVFQTIDNIPNGIYKLKMSVKTDVLAEDNDCQYVYANEDKTYLDTTDPKVYEVQTVVTDHRIEIGVAQTKGVADNIYFDNVSVELIEEAPNGRDLEVSVYTAYLTIKGGMAIDGLNRIYVDGCHDLENFDIPREDWRFNVEVAAAGSMSTGFMGEPGLGKVTLTWEEQDENVEDILGYNMYRFTGENDSTAVKINQRLLNGTEYVDYDVQPGTNYNYYYKIMRTDLSENSPSLVVSVTPLTASKGDANGSMTVDVADVVTEVNHMLGHNPQPFIFEAADVNNDGEVNILDVVGTINIILKPSAAGIQSVGAARYWVEDEVLYVDSEVPLAGLQFRFNGVDSKDVAVLDDLKEFETIITPFDGDCMFLAYSMVGKSLSAGKHALLRIGEGVQINQVSLSDPQGTNVVSIASDVTSIESIEAAQMKIPYPNPFDASVSIPFVIGKAGNHKVEITFVDIAGRTVDGYSAIVGYGEHSYTWQPSGLSSGIYFASLRVDGKQVQTSRLIKR